MNIGCQGREHDKTTLGKEIMMHINKMIYSNSSQMLLSCKFPLLLAVAVAATVVAAKLSLFLFL